MKSGVPSGVMNPQPHKDKTIICLINLGHSLVKIEITLHLTLFEGGKLHAHPLFSTREIAKTINNIISKHFFPMSSGFQAVKSDIKQYYILK